MTGVGDKLDSILEKLGALEKAQETRDAQLAALEKRLIPVFFQANAVTFCVKALVVVAAVASAVAGFIHC